MSVIPTEDIEYFFKSMNEYRKHTISKLQDYVKIDLTILPILIAFFFDKMTDTSKILSVILFCSAFFPKWFIITRRLEEYSVDLDDYWATYKGACSKYAKEQKRDVLISGEMVEYMSVLKQKATDKLDKKYSKLMVTVNNLITISFLCILVVIGNLLRLGFANIFGGWWFDLIIIAVCLLIISIIFGVWHILALRIRGLKNRIKVRSKS